MTILDTATVLMQSKNYSGSGDWLDESGNGHDAAPQNSPTYAGGVFTLDSVNQFFYIADHADLDFAAAESFTAIALVKPSGTVVGTDFIVSKKTSANDTAGWAIYHTSANVVGKISDGTEAAPYVGSALSVGSAASVAFVRNVADDDIELFYDGTGGGSPVNDDTTGSLATGNPVHLGAQSPSAAFYFLGDYIAFALWRSALTDAQVLEASYYLTNGEPSVAVSGTAVSGGVTEGEIIVGGETIILTLTNDTWHADLGTDDASTDALIAGIDSDGSEGTGWDAVVKANMTFADVARTSNTVVTITLGAESTYQITADETITVTIPAAAINGPEPFVAAPTFDVTAYVPPSEGSYAGYGSVGALRARITADGNTPVGYEPSALVAQIVGSTIQSEVLGHLVAAAGATSQETLGALLEVIAADGGTTSDVREEESALIRFAEVYEP